MSTLNAHQDAGYDPPQIAGTCRRCERPFFSRTKRATCPTCRYQVKPTKPMLGKPLARHEIGVVKAVATGASNEATGKALGITTDTVKIYVQHIFAKTGVTSRTGLAMWWIAKEQAKAKEEKIEAVVAR